MEAGSERAADEIRRTEIDGVPAFVAAHRVDGPPVRVALVFRVGRADEELARHGLTHLVEHLAMFGVGRVDYQANALVDDVRTVFHAAAEPDEAAHFLTAVGSALASLPLDRLESEKRVLETESSAVGPSLIARALARRFGARTYGLGRYREFALTTASEDDVARWARERFTRANACIWVAGELPDGVTLGLPDGAGFRPPALTPLRGLELPSYSREGSGGVFIGALAERGYDLMVGMAIAGERLHERLRIERALTYGVSGSYDPLTASTAHVLLGADCLDEHAADVRDEVVAAIDALAADGPTPDELEHHRGVIRRARERPERVLATLDGAAMDELLGRPPATPDELADELEAVDVARVAAAMRSVRDTTILIVPEESPPPEQRFNEWGMWDRPRAVEGRRFRQRGLSLRRQPVGDVVVGTDAVTLRAAGHQGGTVTIRFEDCVAVTRSNGGLITIHAADESEIRIVPSLRRNPGALIAALHEAIPASKWITLDEETGER